MTTEIIEIRDEPRILLAATHPQQCTGYARVGAMLANFLAARGFRVIYFGYQGVVSTAGRTLHDRVTVIDVGKEIDDPLGFGETFLPKVIREHTPRSVILYNDVLILNRFLDQVVGVCKEIGSNIISYIDLVHDDELPEFVGPVLSRSQRAWVFSEHWASSLRHQFPGAPPIDVVPHAMDQGLVERASNITPAEAKKALGIDADYVVINTNRNSYRKALDLTIDAFLRFWRDLDPRARARTVLLLNSIGNSPAGVQIGEAVTACARRLGLQNDLQTILERHVLGLPNGGTLDETVLARVYRASDVGLNTCLGEGFGLCQLEGAALGVPQIATATGGLKDILQNRSPHVLVPPRVHMMLPRAFIEHGGTMDIPDPADVASALRTMYDAREATRAAAIEEAPRVRQAFSWSAFDMDTIADALK